MLTRGIPGLVTGRGSDSGDMVPKYKPGGIREKKCIEGFIDEGLKQTLQFRRERYPTRVSDTRGCIRWKH